MTLSRLLQRVFSALLLCSVLAIPALAMDIGDAKARGLVGETARGYAAAVQASAEVNALVASVNAQRKARYLEIARKNGISLEAVEARAGQRAMEMTPAGQFINPGSGWQKK